MTDIVDELRARALQGRFNLEAADEIEQMRAALSELSVTPEEARAGVARSKAIREERDTLRAELDALRKEADKFSDGVDWIQRAMQAEAELDALKAWKEEVEKQEPVAWLHETRRDSDVVTSAVKHVWGKVAVGSLAAYSIPLYLAPGAKGE